MLRSTDAFSGRHFRIRPDFQCVDAVSQPFASRRFQGGGSSCSDIFQGNSVSVGAAAKNLAAGQDIRLAAKTADAFTAADETSQELHAHFFQFLGFRPRGQKTLQFLIDRPFHLVRFHSRLHVDLDGKKPGNLAIVDVNTHFSGNLVIVDQALVQARGLARTQQLRGQKQAVIFCREDLRHVPDLGDPGLRHAVLDGLALLAAALGDPGLMPGDGRSRRDVAEILLDFGQSCLGVNVTGNGDYGIVRPVIGREPLVGVLQLGSRKVLHGTDHRPGIGMAGGKASLGDQFFGDAIGFVVILTLLVLHNAALFVELGLVDGALQMAHAIRFQPQSQVESRSGHILEIVGPILVGRAVQIGCPDFLHGLEVIVIVILTAVEHQVLEKVGETRPSWFFVLGTHVVPDVESHDRRLVVLVNDERQAVVQDELLERNIDFSGRGGFTQGTASCQS